MRSSYPKHQLLQWNKGSPVLRDEGHGHEGHPLSPPIYLGDIAALQREALLLQWGDRPRLRRQLAPHIPAWVTLEKKVLRFKGYLLQYLQLEREVTGEGSDPPVTIPPQNLRPLGLGGHDEYCVRSVVVRYYMLDHTIEVVEPRVPNCGLQQGLLLSRQPIPNPASPDSNYHFSDLNLGNIVNFYGRKITIADCDLETKDILESEGVEMNAPVPIPSDPYLRLRASQADTPCRESDLKELLGLKTVGTRRGEGLSSERPLKFFGLFSSGGESVSCAVLLQKERPLLQVVRQQRQPGLSSVLLRWCVPDLRTVAKLPTSVGVETVPHITALDLSPPVTIHIYGRRLDITGCDAYTQDFLDRLGGVGKAAPATVEKGDTELAAPVLAVQMTQEGLETITQSAPQTSKRQAPNSPSSKGVTGLMAPGTAGGLGLAPSAPVTDTRGGASGAGRVMSDVTGRRLLRPGLLNEYQDTVLRFSTVLNSRLKDDQDRQFILSYFLADHTIQLAEKARAGGLGGKVISRTKLMKPRTADEGPQTEHYSLKDISIGCRLSLYGRSFTVTGCDRRVLTFVETSPELATPALRESVRRYFAVEDQEKSAVDEAGETVEVELS